jgi:hypothetical protein
MTPRKHELLLHTNFTDREKDEDHLQVETRPL